MKDKYFALVTVGLPITVALFDAQTMQRLKLADAAAAENMELVPFCVALVDCFGGIDPAWIMPDYAARKTESEDVLKRAAFMNAQEFANQSVAEKDDVLRALAFRQINTLDLTAKLREMLPGMIADGRVVEAE